MKTHYQNKNKIYYHLPGLFEFYDLYELFFDIFYNHNEFFYDWCDIGSVYGAPADCLWGGGRVGFGEYEPVKVRALLEKYKIPARLTFSNSLLEEKHFSDKRCNELCKIFENERNGIIIYSDQLMDYIKEHYPLYHFISTTTKVITDFDEFKAELKREDYKFVVPDFRLNKSFERLSELDEKMKAKVEFLANECCSIYCEDRKKCYENVSQKSLGNKIDDHICKYTKAGEGYLFSKTMKNPSFISIDDIVNKYITMGFTNFKIEGRSLGSALILEFLLYYMTKPEYQLRVRELIYLDSMLDIF